MLPKITVVTPNYNLGGYLEDTIHSIVGQNYPSLEYIIVDGGSTDNSVDIIKKYEKQLAWWISEPDHGMYDALDKGFRKSTGEIMLWVNSDDLLFPRSLFSIAKVFQDIPEINWIHGMKAKLNEEGTPIEIREPRPFSYYSIFLKDYKWIQQEAVAWRRSLYLRAGGFFNKQYRYAGDFELWTRFLKVDTLFSAPILVGGFRNRSGQLSKLKDDGVLSKYESEVADVLVKLEVPMDFRKIALKNSSLLRLARWMPSMLSKSLMDRRAELLRLDNRVKNTKDGFRIIAK